MRSEGKVNVWALEPYERARLTLIPLHRWDHVDGAGRPRGKSPRDRDWTRREYGPGEALEWARSGGNVGVRLSADWVVVDVDPRNFPEGRDVLWELDLEVGLELDTAPRTRTGSGGMHYWFRKDPGALLVDSLPDFPGVEFKSAGRQVVAAGSVHPCGSPYEWLDGPRLAEARQLPERLVRLTRRPQPSQGEGGGELSQDALVGCLELLDPADFRDHDRWLSLMMACHHSTAGEGRSEFVEWSTQDPPYAEHAWEIGRRWDSLHLDRGGGSVTVRFLYKCIIDAGKQVPGADPEDDFEPVDGSAADASGGAEDSPRTLLEQMNERHCCVLEGGKFRIFREDYDPVLERRVWVRMTDKDFRLFYSNRRVPVPAEDGEEKTTPMGTWWLSQGGRRQYDGVIFDPERQHPGWLNLWRGWSVEPRQGQWDMLRDLILEVLCDGDRAAFDYVLDWSAYMVQRPSRAAEVALVFRGDKGTGKGTFGRALLRLAGSHGLHISSPEHLTGRFNAHLRDCITLFADEAFWAGDKAGEAKLKQLVTEPTMAYEGKGRDIESGKNMVHVVVASNSAWVVPAGLDGERRFAVFEVNRKAQGDKARFRAIERQLEGGGLGAMLYDLLQRPLRDWAPRDSVPQTSALTEQKLQTLDPFQSWWHERLSEGHLPHARGEWDGATVVSLKGLLRASYADHCRSIGARRALTLTQFGIALAELVPGARSVQVRLRDGEFGVPTDVQGRATAYELPPLEECRAAFAARLGAVGMRWTPPAARGEDV